MEKSEGMLMIFAVAAVLIIFVIVKAILKVRIDNSVKVREEYDPVKAGKVPIELTCAMCGKKFMAYADPGLEDTVRKNKNRCPECEKSFKDEMGWSARHIMWWR